MTVTSDVPPARQLTVATAAQEARDALFRVGMHFRSYHDIRTGTRSVATTRARGEWGLACLEWAAAVVVHQAAIDRDRIACRHSLAAPPGNAGPSAGEFAPSAPEGPAEAGPQTALSAAQSRLDRCQLSYEDIRAGTDPAAIEQARNAWSQALSERIWVTLACKADEDDARRRGRRSQDAGMKIHPDDAFPGPRTREQEITSDSRERTRRDAIERDQHRYDRPRSGARRAGPSSRPI